MSLTKLQLVKRMTASFSRLFLKDFFNLCVKLCVYMWIYACVYRGQKRVSGPLELKLYAVVSCLVWALGMDLGPL